MNNKNKINFINKEHEDFYKEKMKVLQQYGKTDVYYRSIVYTLGICPTTRENFEQIFDIQNGEININSLQGSYQTGTSEKVTRMAFSLWNRCMYDSEKDIEDEKISRGYNICEIFSCSYAPYFYESIKIRYPEYTNEINNYYIQQLEKINEYYTNDKSEDADNLLADNDSIFIEEDER